MDPKIFSESIDGLATKVEEGARASLHVTQRFIEPAQGTLRRAKSKRHHLIFGRRGSGKSSLLYKSATDLSLKNHPIIFIDLEPFKGHSYPDIIISVLLTSFAKLKVWMQKNLEDGVEKRGWHRLRFFGNQINDKAKLELIDRTSEIITDLTKQLYLVDNSTLQKKLNELYSSNQSGSSGIDVGSDTVPLKFESTISSQIDMSHSEEVTEEYKRSKNDYLLQKMLEYRDFFHQLYQVHNKDCYLFLDDLYHILRKDQASLIDYFHRISKGNNLWLKIGTIRNRTTWYKHTPQPLGLKTGDDADEINLDLTLEKFSLSKDFLKKVISVYIKEIHTYKIDEILTDGGMDRLVLSCGGVARDFLGIFRRSIDEARERLTQDPHHARGDKIGAEDVNLASGAFGEVKREEFQRDTLEDRAELEKAFEKIRIFCLNNLKKNLFLVDIENRGADTKLLEELIDLRLIHQVKSRVTVSSKPGKVYKAYILDVSQYTGERARRDVEIIEFWKPKNKEAIRLASLIYDPSVGAQIDNKSYGIKRTGKKNSVDTKDKTDNQNDLFDH